MPGKRKPVTFEVTEEGCHNCTSHAPGTHGYPTIWKNGRNQNAHRVLYEEACGPIGTGLVVRHDCDNVLCINLKHLRVGTFNDNAQDRNSRGRNNPPHGERSGTAKLTANQVLEIRASNLTDRELSTIYNVGPTTINRIRGRKRWASI